MKNFQEACEMVDSERGEARYGELLISLLQSAAGAARACDLMEEIFEKDEFSIEQAQRIHRLACGMFACGVIVGMEMER